MSGGSGCAIITGATATTTAAWFGVPVTGTTIITTITIGTDTTTIITGTTTGIVTDGVPVHRCVTRAVRWLVLRRVFRTEGPPTHAVLLRRNDVTGSIDEREMNAMPTSNSEMLM